MQLTRQIQLYIFFITCCFRIIICCFAAACAAVWRGCSFRATAAVPAPNTPPAAVAAAWAARYAFVITFLQAAPFLQAGSWLTQLASLLLLLLLLPPAR
jgi:hypothetical protein